MQNQRGVQTFAFHSADSIRWGHYTCVSLQEMQLFILSVFLALGLAVPPQEKRVHHQRDLSDHAHDDAHGYQYDHEAFLGKEEAKTFDQLTPEESKARLGYRAVLTALVIPEHSSGSAVSL